MNSASHIGGWVLLLASGAGQIDKPLEPPREKQADEVTAEPVAVRLTRILTREEEPDDKSLARSAQELAALADVTPLLLAVVGSGRTPAPDELRLAPRQLELALEALQLAGGKQLATFLRSVESEPESPERVAAAMRIVARQSDRDAIAVLTRLAGAAESHELFPDVEDAFESALGELLARDPSRMRRLAGPFTDLTPAAAAVAVRAVGSKGSVDALHCLRTQLGHRLELDGPVLIELARLTPVTSTTEARELANEVVPYLRSTTAGVQQAAATLLGRLAVPDTVPGLIECLIADDAGTVRAVLAALRSVGGVGLPASVELWRDWYGREETWWQERAVELFVPSAPGASEEQVLGDTSARLREISEHRLHRHELVPRLTPLLSHPRPAVRVLACECLARLGSRAALPALQAMKKDPASEVTAAAKAAVKALEDGQGARSARRPAS